jgi:putative flippase GtrA
VSAAVHVRLAKFCLAGGIGVGVQLGALALFCAMKLDYLRATGLAVECAILHNFLWHWHFTFLGQARAGMRGFLLALVRFHLSNGAISLFGNMLLMRLLVGSLRLPLLCANLASIAACFVANFLASDRWVFRSY